MKTFEIFFKDQKGNTKSWRTMAKDRDDAESKFLHHGQYKNFPIVKIVEK